MAQSLLTQVVGLRDNAVLNVNQLAINASTTRLLFGFIPVEANTLSKVRVFLTAVTGTLGANDMVCELHSMPTGLQSAATGPLALLQSVNTVTAVPTGSQWVEFTGFSTAVSAGVLYALVIRNANGSPTTNSFTIRWVTGNSDYVMGSSGALGWMKKHSTNSGSTYGTVVGSVAGVRLEFSDGSFIGLPVSQGAVMAAADGVYADRESGAKFTTPADVKLRIRGVGGRISVSGTPTGSPRFRLYQGTTLVATTELGVQYNSTNYLVLPFATTVVLDPSTSYRVVLSETTQSDAVTNRFVLYEYTVEDDANSKALLPFGGWVKTYFDGTVWTDTDTNATALYLFLDTDDPFDATGTGGGGGSTGGVPVLGGGVVR